MFVCVFVFVYVFVFVFVFVTVFVSTKQEYNIGGEQSRRRVGAEKQKRNSPDALPSISVFVSVFGSVSVFASKFVFVTVFVSAKGAYWRAQQAKVGAEEHETKVQLACCTPINSPSCRLPGRKSGMGEKLLSAFFSQNF